MEVDMVKPLTNVEFWEGTVSTKSYPSRWSASDREFISLVQEMLPRAGDLLEIGCGCSYWLPYFADLGYRVHGIDFSPVRLRKAINNLDRHGIASYDLRTLDFLDPPEEWLGKFDVVFSAGVVEHFTCTVDVIRAMSRYLKDDGIMITTVPHLRGIYGWLARRLNPEASKGYLELNLEHLVAAHRGAHLNYGIGSYTRSLGIGVLNGEKLPGIIRGGFYLAASMLDKIPIPQLSDSLCAGMLVVAERGPNEAK